MLGHKASLNKFGSSKISNLSFRFKKLGKEKINPKNILKIMEIRTEINETKKEKKYKKKHTQKLIYKNIARVTEGVKKE